MKTLEKKAVAMQSQGTASYFIRFTVHCLLRDMVGNSVGGSEYAQPLVEGGRPKPAARSKNRERRERLAKIDYSDSGTNTCCLFFLIIHFALDSDSSSGDRPPKKPGAVRKARKRPVAKAVATPVVPTTLPSLSSLPTPVARC